MWVFGTSSKLIWKMSNGKEKVVEADDELELWPNLLKESVLNLKILIEAIGDTCVRDNARRMSPSFNLI